MSEPLTVATDGVVVEELPPDAAERVSRRSQEWFAQARWLLFSFDGRIDRRTFLLCGFLVYAVPLSVVGLVLLLLDPSVAAIGTPFSGALTDGALIVGLILGLPILMWINLAVTFKRLHDFGAALGMFLTLSAIGLIPYLGTVASLVVLFRPGDSGPNIYGNGPGWRPSNEPLERANSSVLSLR
jgi:uncharacterized membrane protein YhaH (DUF805 family)